MTLPYGIVSDCHLHNWSAFSQITPDGLNTRLVHILDQIKLAALDTAKQSGKRLYITGDLFHVRGSVSPTVLNPAIGLFNAIWAEHGIETRILAGNHDLESRDSNVLSNACESLRMLEGVAVVSEPQMFADDKVVMVPWFDKLDDVRAHIKTFADGLIAQGESLSAWTLMLHAPINGVLIGLPDHGFYAKELEVLGFKRVFSGHYHNHKRFDGEVYSVGAATHQTWNDVGTGAGHLLVDDSGVAFVESKAPQFIDYDSAWDDDQAIERVAGNYVRVKLGQATDEEISLIRDHIDALGSKGVLVQAIPIPKSAATARSASVASASTVRQSINDWIKANSTLGSDLEKLCDDIINEAEAVTV